MTPGARLLLHRLVSGIEVPTRVHAFVKDANDLDDASGPRAIEDHMNRLSHTFAARIASHVSQVETANPRAQLGPVPRERAGRLCGELFERVEQERVVSLPGIAPPSLGADAQNVRQIALRRPREAKSRHRVYRRVGRVVPSSRM